MSLLWMDCDADFERLIDVACEYEVRARGDYFDKKGEETRKIFYRDMRYNITFLYTSYLLQDGKIMEDYARWLFRLMAPILKDLSPKETADYLYVHLDAIRDGIRTVFSGKAQAQLLELIDRAGDKVALESSLPPAQPQASVHYEEEVQRYLHLLFQKNTRQLPLLIQEFVNRGIPLTDLYVEILAESMRRIGELWHTGQISVATEHYCTSATLTVMSQLYSIIFAQKRKHRSVLFACPGTELHELGARMIADLFENDGWDTIYLGAAVPEKALFDAIRTQQPDLVALSVTMPQHLIVCQELTTALRAAFPDIRIAVGGHAFHSTQAIWSKWPIDIYTEDARELLEKANEALDNPT